MGLVLAAEPALSGVTVRAPGGPLDTYDAERRPPGARVLDRTRARIGVLRPDGVVARATDTPSGAGLEAALHRWAGPAGAGGAGRVRRAPSGNQPGRAGVVTDDGERGGLARDDGRTG